MLEKIMMWTTTKKNKPTWMEHPVDPFHLHGKQHSNNNNNKNNNNNNNNNNKSRDYSFNVKKLLTRHSSKEVCEFVRNIFDGLLLRSNAEEKGGNKAREVNIKLTGMNLGNDLIVTLSSDGSRLVLQKQLSWIEKKISMSEQMLKEDDDNGVNTPDGSSWTPYYGMRRNNSMRRKPVQRCSSLPSRKTAFDNHTLQLQRRHTYEKSCVKVKNSERLRENHVELSSCRSVFDNSGFEACADDSLEISEKLAQEETAFTNKTPCSEREIVNNQAQNTNEMNNNTDEMYNPCRARYVATSRDGACTRAERVAMSNFSRQPRTFHMFGCKETKHLRRTPTLKPGSGCGFLEYPYTEGTLHTDVRCS